MVLFLGAGVSFAASPSLRGSVYSSTESVTSIDNRQIVSTNLDTFNFDLKINSVKENGKNYYVEYTYQTLAIIDSVWQPVSHTKTLEVNKESLGDKDLGLYVAKELADDVNDELSYLKDEQNLEKEKGVTEKIVTVEYAGLIGKLLDPKEKVLEGYDPVTPEPMPEQKSEPVPVYETPSDMPGPELEKPEKPAPEDNPDIQIPSPQILPAPNPVDEDEVRKIVQQMLSEHQEQPADQGPDTGDDASGDDATSDTSNDSSDGNSSQTNPPGSALPPYDYPTPTPPPIPSTEAVPF